MNWCDCSKNYPKSIKKLSKRTSKLYCRKEGNDE